MAIMEQQEHIATLCAAGTVGIAAAGFALGSKDNNVYSVAPGKRKWPGASSTKSPDIPQTQFVGRRSVSQPATSTTAVSENPRISRSSSLFRKRTLQEFRPKTANQSETTGSRGSSLNRSSILRPRTTETRATSERRDASTGSSWLKRISTVSSLYSSSPATSIAQHDATPAENSVVEPASIQSDIPNKLVKRSTSQRALFHDHARGSFLRRPVTSHQRTATLKGWAPQNNNTAAAITPTATNERADIEQSSPPLWRPFFERGYPRKRHSIGGVRDVPIVRTISTLHHGQPTLLLGRSIEPSELPEDQTAQSEPQSNIVTTTTTSRQRLRRSLSSMHRASRRRYFTDPVVKVNNETVNGTFSPLLTQSPLSPVSNMSGFDVELPHGSPAFTSSPTFMPVKHRFSFHKRESTAPSDPTTVSSDNDTRVFTDDDSMDFHSDTAFDSLATRATVSSHSATKAPKLDTIFTNTHPYQTQGNTALEDLMQRTTLRDQEYTHINRSQGGVRNHGIGIAGFEESDCEVDLQDEEVESLTPVKSTSKRRDEHSTTPVAKDIVSSYTSADGSLEPARRLEHRYSSVGNDSVHRQLHFDDGENIDWSPMSNVDKNPVDAEHWTTSAQTSSAEYSSPGLPLRERKLNFDDHVQEDKRMSIFDWSEQQRVGGDLNQGDDARPKTVHGKQVNDNSRSRSSGRKGANQLHLRSQSVPNNRDSHAEQIASSTSKFSTWGLGHKPVSEEWSDDFEFDDVEEETEEPPQISVSSTDPSTRGSIRGVKVPQSIMDRQASVHIQFGQVQEFMLLVEELKRLRARGTALDLVENHSKQLWDDAESIINLATINDEDDEMGASNPRSPATSDIFGDEVSVASRNGNGSVVDDDRKRNSMNQRSFSSPATPPYTRPRGESLAQAKNFLQTIHQNRNPNESSPLSFNDQPHPKLPFDTQDLKDLVLKSAIITRALKEIVRRAEGVSVSPSKTPPRSRDPPFSQIFNAPDTSPCPPFRNSGLPKSRSAHSYLSGSLDNHHNNASGEVSTSFTTLTAMV